MIAPSVRNRGAADVSAGYEARLKSLPVELKRLKTRHLYRALAKRIDGTQLALNFWDLWPRLYRQ